MTEHNNILYFKSREGKTYIEYLEIQSELAFGNLTPEKRSSLEDQARRIESKHRDFTLSLGGGIESDYPTYTQPQKLGGRK